MKTFQFFNYQGFLSQTLTIDGTAGEIGGHLCSSLPLSANHEHPDFSLQLCMWGEYHIFVIATPVNTTTIWWDLPPSNWWWNVNFYLLDDLILVFVTAILKRENSGFELASPITPVLQANWLNKDASHPAYQFCVKLEKTSHNIYFDTNRNGFSPYRADIYLLKVNNRSTRTMNGICSKLTIKTPERRHHFYTPCKKWFSYVFRGYRSVDVVLVSLLLTLNRFHTSWCLHRWFWTRKCRLSTRSFTKTEIVYSVLVLNYNFNSRLYLVLYP